MAHLLVRMLQLAGITSYHTWIGSRHLPYKYSDIALPQVDNHMICTYKDAGKYYYLDATDPYLKFGYATSFIQGKEAFINIDASKYEIATVPDVDTNMNTVYDTVWLRLEGSKIVGKGIAHFTGYQKALYTNIFMDETYKEITQSLNTYFQKGSNKFLVDTFRLYHLMSKDSDLIVTYDFNIEDYAKSSDDEIFINLHLDKTLLKATIEKNRQHDMFRPEKVKIVYKIYLEIPTGYRIEYMPDNTSFYDPQFGFRIGYKQDKLVVDKTETIILNTLLLKQADFKTWNNMVSKIRESYNKPIILKKK